MSKSKLYACVLLGTVVLFSVLVFAAVSFAGPTNAPQAAQAMPAAPVPGGQPQPGVPMGVPSDSMIGQTEAVEPMFFDRVIKAYQDGGEYMHVILVISMFALAIILERFYLLVFRYDINGVSLMGKVQRFVVDNQVDKAIKLCNQEPNAVLPRVLKAGLKRATHSQAEIQAAVDVATLEVLSLLQKRTPYLALFANISTLAGLLGTIVGLIQAFDAIKLADPAQKQLILSNGIAIAMNATAFGLLVAIPSMIAFGFLTSKTSKIIDEIDTCSAKLVDLLTIAGKRS